MVGRRLLSPPLAMERESVLDRYFDDISVEPVNTEQDRWDKIKDNQRLDLNPRYNI